ncbi:MAG: ECF-type sigma factor, partial [Pseudomonadota bacterium]
MFEYVYQRLKIMASGHLRGRFGSENSPTAVVSDTYLKLRELYPRITDRKHFFRLASRVMHNVIVDEYRKRAALRRHGNGSPTDPDHVPADMPPLERVHNVAAAIEEL